MTYTVHYEYSKDGKNWHSTTVKVKATSDSGAISQLKSKYPYTRNIQIKSIK